jgi:hypothetical protein
MAPPLVDNLADLLQNEWINISLDTGFCQAIDNYEIKPNDLLVDQNAALLELNATSCLNNLKITNLANTQEIILYFKDGMPKFGQALAVIGKEANITILSPYGALLKDVITSNVGLIKYTAFDYKGLETHGEPANDKVWIYGLKGRALEIFASKVILANILELEKKATINLAGDHQGFGFSFDTQKLEFFSSSALSITDQSKNNVGINLYGKFASGQTNIQSDNSILLNADDFIAKRFVATADNAIDVSGKVKAASIKTHAKNQMIREGGELRTVALLGDITTSAKSLEVTAVENIICKKNGSLTSGMHLRINAGKEIDHNGKWQALSNIYINNAKEYLLNLGNGSEVISHNGALSVNKSGKLQAHGLLLAKGGKVHLESNGDIDEAGVIFANSGITMRSNQTVSLTKANIEAMEHWRTILGEENAASIINTGGEFGIEAAIVDLGNGLEIINTKEAANLVILANQYIRQNGSIISVAHNMSMTANGCTDDGKGIILVNGAQVISAGKIDLIAKNDTQLEGIITGKGGVSLNNQCIYITDKGVIISDSGDIAISMDKCHFINNGAIGGNKALNITSYNGTVENLNLMVGKQMNINVFAYWSFINSGQVFTTDKLVVRVSTGAKILFTKGAITQVGSYEFGNVGIESGYKIGGVECSGCEFINTGSGESSINAEKLLIKISDYIKSLPQLIGQKTFITDQYKEKEWNGNVIHHQDTATISLFRETHKYGAPASWSGGGKVDLNTHLITIDASSMSAREMNFVTPATIEVIARSTKEYLDVRRGDITWRNSLSNVKDNFALTTANVIATTGGGYHIFRYVETLNAVMYAEHYDGVVNNIDLLATDSSVAPKPNKYYVPTIDSSSTDGILSLELPNFSEGLTNRQQYKERGYNLFDPSNYNQQSLAGMFEVNNKVPPSGVNLLWPLVYLKNSDTEMASLFKPPLDIQEFLSKLGFSLNGITYIKGDSFLLRKLVNEAVLSLLSVVANQDNTKLLNVLTDNAIHESKRLGLVLGNKLSNEEISKLDYSILWPVWQDNCFNSNKCLTFQLYFSDASWNGKLSGASLVSKSINLKILENLRTTHGAQLKAMAMHLDIKGNVINLGELISEQNMNLTAFNIGNAGFIHVANGTALFEAKNDIVNIGTFEMGNGSAVLKAGRDIIDLVLVNPADPIPANTQAAMYVINGQLYKLADRNIYSQGGKEFVSGNITKAANENITTETKFQARVTNEVYTRKYYLIQRTIDTYNIIAKLEAILAFHAGNTVNLEGLSEAKGNIDITGKKVNVRSTYSQTENAAGAKTSSILGKSARDVVWSYTVIAPALIHAGGNATIVASGKCYLEGATYLGNIPKILCDGGTEAFPLSVKDYIHQTSTKTGIMPPKIPLVEFGKATKPAGFLIDNVAIFKATKETLNMQGVLDIAAVMKLTSELARINQLGSAMAAKYGVSNPTGALMAVISDLVSAKVSYGKTTTTMKQESITNIPTTIKGQGGVEISAKDGNGHFKAADIKTVNGKIKMVFGGNLIMESAQNTVKQSVRSETSSIDLGISLNGIRAGASYQEFTSKYTSVTQVPATVDAPQIEIIVGGNFEIKCARLNGKDIEVEVAKQLLIKDRLDTKRTESRGYGTAVGVSVSWSGAITPDASLNAMRDIQKSSLVSFLSGITGDSVKVTTKELVYNIAHITGKKELLVLADEVEFIDLLENTNTRVSASISGGISFDSEVAKQRMVVQQEHFLVTWELHTLQVLERLLFTLIHI